MPTDVVVATPNDLDGTQAIIINEFLLWLNSLKKQTGLVASAAETNATYALASKD